MGFETAIWHFRSATSLSCFYWASKLLSGTFSAPLKTHKTLKTLPAAFDGLSLLCHGAVSVGLRNCYLARFQHPLKPTKPSKPSQKLSTAFRCFPWVLPRPHELFLLGFETAIWHFRSATSCFYWASKLLSGTFSAPLKTLKTLNILQQFLTAFRCFCHGPSRGPTSCFCWVSKLLSGTSEAPQAVSIGLRLGFETASWHVFSLNPLKASKPSQQLSVSIGLQNCYLARFSAPLKTFKSLKTLPAAFDGLSLLCHGTSRGPTGCFCWASKLLSDTSEAPQAVSIGLRNCYLARFQHPLKPSIPSKPSQQLSTAFRCFAMGPPEAPGAVSVGL